jgi:hypothetical protein
MNLNILPEHQVIRALCLGVNKDGTPRKHPRKELYKLVTTGQTTPDGRRVRLEAYQVAGKFVVTMPALEAFMAASKI